MSVREKFSLGQMKAWEMLWEAEAQSWARFYTMYNFRQAEWTVWEGKKVILKTGPWLSWWASNQQQGAAMYVHVQNGALQMTNMLLAFILTFKASLSVTFNMACYRHFIAS